MVIVKDPVYTIHTGKNIHIVLFLSQQKRLKLELWRKLFVELYWLEEIRAPSQPGWPLHSVCVGSGSGHKEPDFHPAGFKNAN